MATNENEVTGNLVHVTHVDESGTDPVETVLALTTKDGLEFSTDEDEEDINLSSERRTRRYRTHNTADLSVESLVAVDMEAAEMVGIVDSNGKLDFSEASRRLGPEEAIHIEYYSDEGATSAELVHRFEDCEAANPEVDIGNNPPLMSWDWIVHGDVYLNYTG